MKWILIPFFIVIFFLVQNFPAAVAAKPKVVLTPSISPSVKYIKAKNVVRAVFGNIKGVSKVSYTLTYQASGVGQGVLGSFSPGKNTSISKDIYLGTCSGKVCVSHKNIKGIQLEVKTKYTNGKSSSKIYKVK